MPEHGLLLHGTQRIPPWSGIIEIVVVELHHPPCLLEGDFTGASRHCLGRGIIGADGRGAVAGLPLKPSQKIERVGIGRSGKGFSRLVELP